MARRKRKVRPKPVINYPPLTTRKWIPPDQRKKKKPPPKWKKPPQMNIKLDISSLKKIWHSYRVITGCAVLYGHFSQFHHKFNYTTNGYQTDANCVVANLFAKLQSPAKWNSYTLDEILNTGDRYYTDSKKAFKHKNVLKIPDLSRDIYIHEHKITIDFKGKKFKGWLYKIQNDTSEDYLENVIKTFFEEYDAGVISTENKSFAIWKYSRGYYLFDPGDHDVKCLPWQGLPGQGTCFLIRFPQTDRLVQIVQMNLTSANIEFEISPIQIERVVNINTDYPQCLDDANLEILDPHLSKKEPVVERVEVEEEEELVEEEEDEVIPEEEVDEEGNPKVSLKPEETVPIEATHISAAAADRIRGNVQSDSFAKIDDLRDPIVTATSKTKKKMFVEKPILDEITFYNPLVPHRTAILLGDIHQEDEEFKICSGKLSLPNAIAALTMLREHKSHEWTSKIVNSIVKLGFRFCVECLKSHLDDKTVTIKNILKKITFNDKAYHLSLKQYGAVGRLQSTDDRILDLLPSLKEVLSEYDNVIIQGPLVIAVWKERDKFFMFDPDERDVNGYKVVREIQVGSVMEVVDHEVDNGAACVMWFRDLKELVDVYMKNVERMRRRENFVISTVDITRFIEFVEDWYKFKGIDVDRWILRAHLSQADRRFERTTRNTQCTAIAAMAIAFAHIFPIAEWTPSILDDIVIKGNKYYKECIADLEKRGKYLEPMLMAIELMKEFIVLNKLICLEIDECLVNGFITLFDDDGYSMNLCQGLTAFFKENDYGIFTCRGISVALWHRGGAYYYYDSHDRNKDGFHTHHGTSCVQRILTIDKLAECLMGNLAPSAFQAIYNLSRIDVEIFDHQPDDAPPDEDDDSVEDEEEEVNLKEKFGVKRPLYNYVQLTKKRAILRSGMHQAKEIFGISAGKQTVPNFLAAIGMSRIFAPAHWSKEILNDVLTVGQSIYEDSMNEYYKAQNRENLREGEDLDENDNITIENVNKNFKIGINKFEVEFTPVIEEQIGHGESLKEALKDFMSEDNSDDPNDFKELLLQTPTVEVVIWKNGGLYFVYDPKARDHRGDIYGREDWTIVVTTPEITEEDEEEQEEEMDSNEEDDDFNMPIDGFNDVVADEGYMDYWEEDVWPEIEERVKKPEGYWEALEEKEGSSCVMWFTKLKCVWRHLMDNIPTKDKFENYTLTKISLVNKPELKNVYEPELGPKEDAISGDWNNFKEVTRGLWILRGTMHEKNEMFPLVNRGYQALANCLIALAFAHVYSLPNFTQNTVDSILKYGDRLYTKARKIRCHEYSKVPEITLTEQETQEFIKIDMQDLRMYPKRFCIGEEKILMRVQQDVIVGEVHAKHVIEELDVQRGVEAFFSNKENTFGILCSKGLAVALWRSRIYYYLFDPHERGPLGGICENGVSCITRYINIGDLAKDFVQTVPRPGKNFFTIHKVLVECQICDEPTKVEMRTERPLALTGFKQLGDGKFLISGNTHQDHMDFARGTNAQSAPIAFVALAMTLIHNCEYWTRPIIDEIIAIGDRVYGKALERCEPVFNPWEEKLTVALTPNDFKIGKIKVNCELRHTDQRGIIDIKDPNIPNLRNGIENFFQENSYGVIETDFLTVAIWEAEDEANYNYIYMFDPNPRSPTGIPDPDKGSACVMKFIDPKTTADHIISLVDGDRDGQFLITPVEIVIERDGKRQKTKKYGLRQKIDAMSESAREAKLGKKEYYLIPNTEIEIIRGSRSQNWILYNQSSRGNQDVPNCIIAYVMDKLIPLSNWNFKTIDMILDVGDQLYKDSFVVYDPKDKKLRLETLFRDVLIRDIKVKISVGAPILTAKFTSRLLTEALTVCFNLKNFCIVLVDETAVAIFKKTDHYYLFDPTDVDLKGFRTDHGTAAVLRFPNLDQAISRLMNNLENRTLNNDAFHIIVVAIKEIEKVPVGSIFGNPIRSVVKDNCDKMLHGHSKQRKSKFIRNIFDDTE